MFEQEIVGMEKAVEVCVVHGMIDNITYMLACICTSMRAFIAWDAWHDISEDSGSAWITGRRLS